METGSTVSNRTGFAYLAPRPPLGERIAYRLRVLFVMSRTEFKLKYAGSVLGYVWSLAKPLMYFTVLWLVFGNLFQTGIRRYPLYLLVGIVLYTFVADAVTATIPSIVSRGAMLRRIAFPPLVIPLAANVTAAMTFAANSLAVVVFVAASQITPRLQWLLLLPLLLELYVFVLGLSLLAATLFVRFRDIGQIWEVGSSLLFFSSPIMYPVTILPDWAERVISFNPFVQILQDVRSILLHGDVDVSRFLTLRESRAFPILITVALLLIALWVHGRESPRFAEVA